MSQVKARSSLVQRLRDRDQGFVGSRTAASAVTHALPLPPHDRARPRATMMPPVTICWTQFGSPCCEQPIWMTVMIAAPKTVPSDRAPAAEQAAAADDHGRDDVELETDGDRRIADREPRELQHAGHARRAPPPACRPRPCVRSIAHAAQPRRPLVRSDREQVPAEARVARARRATTSASSSGQPDARPADRASPPSARSPQQIVQPGDRRLDPPLVGEALRRAAHEHHRAERDDERHDPEPGDEQAVDGAAERRRGHAAERGDQRDRPGAQQQRDRRPCVSATIEPTDRSIPPATMTIVMPSAAMQTIAVCRAISSRLAGAEELRADERRRRRARPASSPSEHDRRRRAQRSAPSSRASRSGRVHHQRVLRPVRAGRGGPSRPRHMTAIAVAEAEQLGQIAADHQHGPAGVRVPSPRPDASRVEQRVDLRLAADVDAARRLVEQQDVDVVVQQARERDLLLVAARQLADRLPRARAADRQPLDPARRGLVCRAGSTSDARSEIGRAATASGCRRCSSPSASPSPLRSSLSMPTPCAPRARAATRPLNRRRRVMRPLRTGLEPEDRAQQPRPAGADQAGDAENLAAAQRERRRTRARRSSTSSSTSPGSRGAARIQIVDAAADHQLDDRVRAQLRGPPPPALRPSRSTTKRSETSFTSSMKCEM